MRSQCAVYVDAGYLLSQQAIRQTGTSLRASITTDHTAVVEQLAAHAEQESGLPLLRVHWYDSAAGGVPDAVQDEIARLPRVKLRLGRTGVAGEQRGVLLRLGLDLVNHARAAAVDVMYLISDDDDLAEAVEQAQRHGVQVVIVAVGQPRGIGGELCAAADALQVLDGERLDAAVQPLTYAENREGEDSSPSLAQADADEACAEPARVNGVAQPAPSPALLANTAPPRFVVPPREAGDHDDLIAVSHSNNGTTVVSSCLDPDKLDDAIDRVVQQVLTTWLDGEATTRLGELRQSRPSIPGELDRALLLDLCDVLDVDTLAEHHRYRLRERFWDQFDHRSPSPSMR